MLKPGYRTSEFGLTVAVDLAVLVSALADALPARYATVAAAAATGLYALARGWAKSGASVPAVPAVSPPVVASGPSSPPPAPTA